MTTSCLVETRYCLYDAVSGTTTCQKFDDCSPAINPCTCVAVAASILLGEDCTVSADTLPEKCQIACVRRKDAGTGSTDGSTGSLDAGKPKDAGAILDVHIPDSHAVPL
jgi:hypothetical protein